MGAHLYRHTGRRDTTTDAKITFEANVPSRGRQFNKPRDARAGCACPAKQHKQPSRGSLPTVGLLQNWGIRRGPVPERVRRSRECRAERDKRRRAADVVSAGAIDATRAGTHFVERTCGERGGKGIRDQPRGRHPMATSVFTQYPIQDLHDHSLRYILFHFETVPRLTQSPSLPLPQMELATGEIWRVAFVLSFKPPRVHCTVYKEYLCCAEWLKFETAT